MTKCYEIDKIHMYVNNLMEEWEKSDFEEHILYCEACFEKYLDILQDNPVEYEINVTEKILEETIVKDNKYKKKRERKNLYYNKVICYFAACIVILAVYTVNFDVIIKESMVKINDNTIENSTTSNIVSESYEKFTSIIRFAKEEKNEEEK